MDTPEEPDRIAALQGLGILDTAPEAIFDSLTQLAALTFNAPVALVSLVDIDRQWFKSCIGLDVSETGRDVAFCDHAIRQDQAMVVLDARQDQRFRDNPLVTGAPSIRFYAGAR
uniref:GAF domain-containing protein n=1 Tax=Phenylobacterium glaciei TaxID=2803784 RepID=A0A974P4N3_9CAUL|nr:GAF domain-containing protein [Phenylobacterium glaciei]